MTVSQLLKATVAVESVHGTHLHFFDVLPIDAHSLRQLTFRLCENLALLPKSLFVRENMMRGIRKSGAEGGSLVRESARRAYGGENEKTLSIKYF